MSSSSSEVAEAFARLIAEDMADELVGESGESESFSVPLNFGGSAELAFNREAGSWILTVANSFHRLSDEEAADRFESLVTRTNMTRFARPAVAGVNDVGEATLSTFITGAPDAIEVEALLAELAELLNPDSDGVPPSDADFEEPSRGPWVRI